MLAGLAFNGSIQSNFPVRDTNTESLVNSFVFHTFLEIGMILTFLSMVSELFKHACAHLCKRVSENVHVQICVSDHLCNIGVLWALARAHRQVHSCRALW